MLFTMKRKSGLFTRLEFERLRRQMSRAQLGRLAGLSDPYIGALERGELMDPGLYKIARLAHVFGLGPEELLQDVGGDAPLEIRVLEPATS